MGAASTYDPLLKITGEFKAEDVVCLSGSQRNAAPTRADRQLRVGWRMLVEAGWRKGRQAGRLG